MPVTRRDFPFLLLGAASTVRADLYDEYLNSTAKKPFVSFLSRKGVPGHAFVGLGAELESSLIVYERMFGLYPNAKNKLASLKIVLGQTDGKLDYRWEDVSWEVEFKNYVTAEQMSVVLKHFEAWSQSAPAYSLLGNDGKNCSMLAADVAHAIGLKVPTGADTTLPWNYIEALRKANQP